MTKKYEYSIICGHHYPEAKVVRRLSDCLELVEYPTNHYFIVGDPGHLPNDVLVGFVTKPYPDPDPGVLSEDPKVEELYDRFVEDAEALGVTLKYGIPTGHFLYEEFVKLGFGSDKYSTKGSSLINFWLFHTMGQIIQQYEQNGRIPEQPTT